MSKLYNIPGILFLSIVFTACGGGGGETNPGNNNIVISGSVGDGPIVQANITILDRTGKVIASQLSDANAKYSISIPNDSNLYPITITASGGTDLVSNTEPDFKLYSTTLKKSETIININPYSTMVYKISGKMGGINEVNINLAKSHVLNTLNFGLDRSIIPDPVNTAITDSNVAHMVKSSEAMAEMIRRTRDMANNVGGNVNGDDIVTMLAADLTDGMIDGSGSAGADNRIAAFANIASAYVIIESLNNRLKVNGMDARQKLDAAILTTKPNSTLTTSDIGANPAMIAQAIKIIDAANAISPDVALSSLKSAIQAISPSTLPDNITNLDEAALDETLTLVKNAPASTLTTFNNQAASTGQNSAPTINGTPATQVAEGSAYNFLPGITDPDDDTLVFSITNKPSWASFNSGTGRLTGTPGFNTAGAYGGIKISVSDGATTAVLPVFSITVTNTNRAPVINGIPVAQTAGGSAYGFLPVATDPDGDTLGFSIINKPSWASFNNNTGQLTGTPGVSAAGTYGGIKISVSDGAITTALPVFSITVTGTSQNRSPAISGTPVSQVAEGSVYNFLPGATDPDGDTLGFSIINKPSWASFNNSTGRLTGTPGFNAAGTYGGIKITVSDGAITAVLPVFSITVSNTNRVPVISGSPATRVTAGNNYSFTPTASDSDGDTLSFTITNKPAWVQFNTSTGTLSGTPVNSDAGNYNNIIITVSDGTSNTGMNAFSIAVSTTQATFKVKITWVAPNTYKDGSFLPISELSGFRIYHGTSATNLVMISDIKDNYATSHVILNLSAGTHYFSVTSYNVTGAESSNTPVVSLTF